MTVTRTLLPAIALCAVLAPPAGAAGVAVVTDPCGPVSATREVLVGPEHDVCSMSMATLSDRHVDEPVRIQLRIRLAGSVDGREPSSYFVGWTAGGCGVLLSAEDANDTHEPVRQVILDCPGQDRRTIELDDTVLAVDAGGRDVVIEITLTGALEALPGDHGYGALLTETWAAAGTRAAGPWALGLYGHDDSLGTYSLLYDHAGPGEAYRIGG